MRRSVVLVECFALALTALFGCGGQYDQPIRSEPSPAARPAASNPAETKPAKPAQAEEPATRPPAPPKPNQRTRPPAGPSIQLSAGVALPQSLPTGTAMGFSVDYQFSSGRPDPAADYFWVIQPSKGQAARQPVKLAAEGTLQTFVVEFRPENGPFQTCVEDQSGNRLSATIPLR